MVFFLSVGLLLDFTFIWEHIGKVMTLLIFITLGKTALNIGALHLFRQPWSRAFLAGLILSQMGEFAFVLSSIGADFNVIDLEGQKLVVSLAALSLALSPLWLMAARRLHDLAPGNAATADELMNTVYGPQLEAITKVKDSCKQFAATISQKADQFQDALKSEDSDSVELVKDSETKEASEPNQAESDELESKSTPEKEPKEKLKTSQATKPAKKPTKKTTKPKGKANEGAPSNPSS